MHGSFIFNSVTTSQYMLKFLKSLLGKPVERQLQILPQNITVNIEAGKTLLETALAHGIAFPHDCTVGTCASCKSKLKQGRVREATPFGYTLSKQELDAGYILACQAFARDELTVVEIEAPGADLPPPESFTGTITSTEALTHDILKVTVRTDRKIHYVAGQYASIKAPGLSRARHYSFADAPQREGRSELHFFIRKVPGGAFTDALFSGKLNGQELAVDGPHGNFHLRGGDAPMVCVVGGSGLAPLLSVLDQARKSRIKRPCILLFGARTQADLYMLDTLHGMADAWLDHYKFVPVLSHEPPDSDWSGARGFVTDFIADMAGDIAWHQAEAYMCGPPPMIDAAISTLMNLGMSLDAIYYDKFTDGRDVSDVGNCH
jgi:p-cymene monooxygenase electron transfer component